jgi:hypothetical protein
MPCALALVRDLTVLEEFLEDCVCVQNGPAGIFRDSHIVAFLLKVWCGQGYVGVDAPAYPVINFVRDTSNSKRNQVGLAAVPVKPSERRGSMEMVCRVGRAAFTPARG